jgi:hypothetical protein
VCLDGQAQEFTPLVFRVFDKIQTVAPGAIVENKRLGAALAPVKQHQATDAPHKTSLRPDTAMATEQSGAPGLPSKSRPQRLRLTDARLSHDARMSADMAFRARPDR